MEIFFWSGMQFQAYELYICMTGMLWLTCDHFVDKVSAMGQPTRPTQPSILPGSVNEYVIFCVVSLQVHLSFASRSIPPYIVLTISTISRGGVKINISCYMIKLDLWPWVPCRKKWFPCAQNKNSFKTVSFQFHFYLRRQFNSSSYTSALDHMYFGDPTISTATRCFPERVAARVWSVTFCVSYASVTVAHVRLSSAGGGLRCQTMSTKRRHHRV